MKDNYSFDLDFEGARRSYDNMFVAYLKTFRRMGLTAIPMRAATGAIGGDMSHEFQVLAATGESEVFYDIAFEEIDFLRDDLDVEQLKALYAATEEKHDAASCPVPKDRLRSGRGIEVGQIFYFGAKYSKPLGAVVTGPDGQEVPVEMGSYGIGVSRLVGALIEVYHDDAGIVWPEPVAPYRVGLINLRPADEACSALVADLEQKFTRAGMEPLVDDRDESAGAKFAAMDLIGLPWQAVVGPRGVKQGVVELKRRADGLRVELSPQALIERLTA
jgi:prolyl-tRNA synthetase